MALSPYSRPSGFDESRVWTHSRRPGRVVILLIAAQHRGPNSAIWWISAISAGRREDSDPFLPGTAVCSTGLTLALRPNDSVRGSIRSGTACRNISFDGSSENSVSSFEEFRLHGRTCPCTKPSAHEANCHPRVRPARSAQHAQRCRVVS